MWNMGLTEMVLWVIYLSIIIICITLINWIAQIPLLVVNAGAYFATQGAAGKAGVATGIGSQFLDPDELWMRIWNFTQKLLLAHFCVFFSSCLILFYVYNALKGAFGWIPGAEEQIDSATPFAELNQTGIFPLIGSIFYLISCYGRAAIVIGNSSEDRKKRSDIVGEGWSGVFKAIKQLFVGTIQFIMTRDVHWAVEISSPPQKKKASPAPSLLTQAEQAYVKEDYTKCVRENVVYPKAEDSLVRRNLLEVKNGLVRSDCRMKNIQTYTRVLTSARQR